MQRCCPPAEVVSDSFEEEAALFKALVMPTACECLATLARAPEEVCVCDFTDAFRSISRRCRTTSAYYARLSSLRVSGAGQSGLLPTRCRRSGPNQSRHWQPSRTESPAMKNHINLGTTDFDRSVSFYSTLLTLSLNKVLADYALFAIDDPGMELALDLRENVQPAADTHFGIRVETMDDVERAIARLSALGLAVDQSSARKRAATPTRRKCGRLIRRGGAGKYMPSTGIPTKGTARTQRAAPSMGRRALVACSDEPADAAQ